MIQEKPDGDLTHCGNDRVISIQILSILLMEESAGFVNELVINRERKRSQELQPVFFKGEIPFRDKMPNFRRCILNGYLINILKNVFHI